MCNYCTADMRLCFRLGKVLFSHDAAHIIKMTPLGVLMKNADHGRMWVLISSYN